MATPTQHNYLDAGAPALNTGAGALIAVLDYILVTNGNWTKPFSGTNTAVYRNAAGNGFDLSLDDTQGNFTRAIRGYKTATAVGVGSDPFPSVATASDTTTAFRKRFSSAAVAGEGEWYAWVTDRFFILVNSFQTSSIADAIYFGEADAFDGSDAYLGVLSTKRSTNSSQTTVSAITINPQANVSGWYVCRRVDQSTAGGIASRVAECYAGRADYFGELDVFPTVPGGNTLAACRVLVGDSETVMRGYMPGLVCPVEDQPRTHAETFAGSGDFAGHNFQAFNFYNGGQIYITDHTSYWP